MPTNFIQFNLLEFFCIYSTTNFSIRQGSAAPANLTRLSTIKMPAIHDSLVCLSRALIRSSPYVVFACPNLPSIGLRSPGLTRIDQCRGSTKRLGLKPNSFLFQHIAIDSGAINQKNKQWHIAVCAIIIIE